MGRNEDRVARVRALRNHAKACSVPVAGPSAGKAKVDAMMEAIRGSSAAAGIKATAEVDYQLYLKTFEGADGKGEPKLRDAGAGQKKSFRLRGRSFLFTWNWSFLERALPDGTPPAADTRALWRLWREWKKEKKATLGVKRSTSTMERSLDSEDKNRVHLHWKIDLEEAIDHARKDAFTFHGVYPDARPTVVLLGPGGKAARGTSFAEASNRGHFYAWAPKRGTLFTGTNWHPFKDYKVGIFTAWA